MLWKQFLVGFHAQHHEILFNLLHEMKANRFVIFAEKVCMINECIAMHDLNDKIIARESTWYPLRKFLYQNSIKFLSNSIILGNHEQNYR